MGRTDLVAQTPAEASAGNGRDRGFRAVRRFFRGSRGLNLFYRVGVATFGTVIVVVGLALVPLPGPGWLIVFAGLALLATEFEWANRLLRFARRRVQIWTSWVAMQSFVRRALFAVGCLVLAAAAVAGYALVFGVPKWVPWIG